MKAFEQVVQATPDTMEDLEQPAGSPVLHDAQEPEGNNDPGDNLQPGIEEEDNARTPPIANPTEDTEAREDDEAPETAKAMDNEADDAPGDAVPEDNQANGADDESELEELEDEQFDNFNPEDVDIAVPDAPVAVDESNVALLGVHKRKRAEGDEGGRKKKKEGRREKPKKSKRVRAGGDDELEPFEGGEEIDGKRQRRGKGGADRPSKSGRRARTPENEDDLSPEERKCCND